MKAAYIITTTVGTSSKSELWDSSLPLPIGYPFQWVMEKTDQGIRVRNLSGKFGKIYNQASRELPEVKVSDVTHGVTLDLPTSSSSQMKIHIKPLALVTPAYESSLSAHQNPEHFRLVAFTCWGNWIAESSPVESDFTGRLKGHVYFKFQKHGEDCTLTSETEGLYLISGKSKTPLQKGQPHAISLAQLILSEITLSGPSLVHSDVTWRFAQVSTQISQGQFNALPAQTKRDEEAELFKKSLGGSFLALLALIVLAWMWPKADPTQEPLVPPQVIKLVMQSHQADSAPPAPAKQDNNKITPIPKKVETAAVVQAFRAKALQSAVSGLLKGGMTKLLAQSDFVSGAANTHEARKLFETKSVALNATGTETGDSGSKSVRVAAIGGQAGAGKTGYGSGEHAGVKNQGHSFVSMDVADAAVEEGLTKDEVGEVIHRHLSEVRYCYESAMLRQPDIEGKLIINFVIGGGGSVKSSEVKSSTLPDPRLDDCIVRRLVTWKFPNPKGSVDVSVSYPFIFKTLGR